MKETEFVLASNSPRRKELLSSIVDRFDVRSADVDERLEDSPAPDLAVKILAERKADAVYRRVKDCYGSGLIVLGCDTVVAYKGKILGKPRDEAEAKQMLSLLSGKTHTVSSFAASSTVPSASKQSVPRGRCRPCFSEQPMGITHTPFDSSTNRGKVSLV